MAPRLGRGGELQGPPRSRAGVLGTDWLQGRAFFQSPARDAARSRGTCCLARSSPCSELGSDGWRPVGLMSLIFHGIACSV